MSSRFLHALGVLSVAGVVPLFLQMPVLGQQKNRTAWGDPDLQGVYTFSTLTPLERPRGIQGKDSYTEAELAELEEQLTATITAEGRAPRSGDPGTYNNFWTSSEKGRLTGRTALIIDPEDGRKPPLTERGKKLRDELVKEATERRVTIGSVQHTLYDSWTDHPAYTRCVNGMEILADIGKATHWLSIGPISPTSRNFRGNLKATCISSNVSRKSMRTRFDTKSPSRIRRRGPRRGNS